VNLERVEQIADAVLYEGYMLYPYRPSSVKNQRRWNFGVLCPASYCEVEAGSESPFMQTECLLRADSTTRLTVKVRFLQIVQRSIGRFIGAASDGQGSDGTSVEFVDRLELDGRVYQPWQEAVERELTYENLDPASLCSAPPLEFNFFEGIEVEDLRDARHRRQGMVVRQWQTLRGTVQIRAMACRDDIVKLAVRVENQSHFDRTAADDYSGREAALPFSLMSAHAVLGVENGEFLSLLDPPASMADLAEQCENKGTFPVLAGEDATAMLASPIILYDYPSIAPESAGNLFDATEIDEILSLRILTLTDEEKQEMRESDDRARELLSRTESMPDEQFIKLHGILRGLGPVKGEPQ
jgi:hydrogenase maturation protease